MTKKSLQFREQGGFVILALSVVMAIVCLCTGLSFFWVLAPLALPIVAFLAILAVLFTGAVLAGAICAGVVIVGFALLLLLLPLFIILLPFIDFDD